MGFKEKQGLRYFQFEIFKKQSLFHAVLTRQGGFSKPPYDSLNTGGTVGDDPQAVLKNHQRIYEVFEYDYFSRFDVWQVHGTDIICADTPRSPQTPHAKADGILTNQHNLTLFMRFADCVPILLFDPEKKVIGIVHAGWQGTGHRIVQIAVEKMSCFYGCQPETLLAGIGPAICQDCYEVGRDVYDTFSSNFGDGAEKYFKHRRSNLYLDLCGANKEILKQAGVTQIESADICTACHPEDWYSHRGQHGKTGRFGVLMSLDLPKKNINYR